MTAKEDPSVEERLDRLELAVRELDGRTVGSIRLGPKPPWSDERWIEEGNRLADAMVAEAKRRLEKPMSVRAKVRCNAKSGNEVHFNTVYETDETKSANAAENARFTKATPWGDIRMGIDNPVAMEQFEVNKEYYVDFTPVAK